MLPPVHITVVSAVPIMPWPPLASMFRLPPCSVITPMPPIIQAPRINVVPCLPRPPHHGTPPTPLIVPTAFVPATPVTSVPAPALVPLVHPPPPMKDEPTSKKLKIEDSLIPEEEFLCRNKGPVSIKVQVPNMQNKTEWKLNGWVLVVFTLLLTDQVFVIKVKIHEAIGMPAGKQKLQYEGIFIKDSNLLVYYNMANSAIINLALKEKGKRKK